MRVAKRRGNPAGGGIHTGLLRFARNDGWLARNDEGLNHGEPPIARGARIMRPSIRENLLLSGAIRGQKGLHCCGNSRFFVKPA
ncbi:MAG: hypothetical protein LBT00_01115 [Spirochaetaceae bacterium]|nr:hypothetical protein [Spirochaetaceae bacterium]